MERQPELPQSFRAGVFSTLRGADRAVRRLLDARFTKEQITVICSDEAKERFQVTVQILTGTCRVQQACVQLGLGSSRLEQVRREIVAGALASAERQRPGRKPRVVSELEWAMSLRPEILQARLRALLRVLEVIS